MLDGAPITSIDAHREVDHIGVQELLTVREIMTPRDRFIACLAGETVFDAFADVPEIYDAVPVLAGNDKADVSAEVVGLLRRADVPNQRWLDPVDDHLDEYPVEAPIAPDLPILEFVERIEGEPVCMIANRDEVIGLVTLFDIERLPVRIALFAQLIDLEHEIGRLIEKAAPDTESWKFMLTKKVQKKALDNGLKRATQRDSIGDAILSIGFSEKLAIVKHLAANCEVFQNGVASTSGIRSLRNRIAHGAPLGDVQRVPEIARRVKTLKTACRDARLRISDF